MGQMTAASDNTCRGLVRVRQQQQLGGGSSRRDDGGSSSCLATLLDTCSDASGLHEDAWYVCVLQTRPRVALQWFSHVNVNDSDDDDGSSALPTTPTNGDLSFVSPPHSAVLLATTIVSHVEAIDDTDDVTSADASNSDDTSDSCTHLHDRTLSASVLEINGVQLDADARTFYMEDHDQQLSYVCEVATAAERTTWLQRIHDALRSIAVADALDDPPSPAAHEEPVPIAQAPLSARRASRPLLRSKTSNLDADDDPFGLRALVTTAFTPSVTTAEEEDDAINRSAGMFAFHQLEIQATRRPLNDANDDFDVDDANDDENERKSTSSNGSTPHAFEPPTPLPKRLLRTRIATTSRRASSPSPLKPIKSQCRRCCKRIGTLFHAAKVCSACLNRFCRDHCNQIALLASSTGSFSSQPPPPSSSTRRFSSISNKKLALVCVDCLVRQQLLTSLADRTAYFEQVVDVGGVSRLIRSDNFAQQPKIDLQTDIQSHSIGPMRLLTLLFSYKQQPFLFVVTLAQFVQQIEFCIETLAFVWPQLLHFGFMQLETAPPSVQTHFLLFLAAASRRSVQLALTATFEAIAAHWDAMATQAYKRSEWILLLLFWITHVSYSERRSVLSELLFPLAPPQQRDALDRAFMQLFDAIRAVYALSHCETPYFVWLLARSEQEIRDSSERVRQQLQSQNGFVDPFVRIEEAQQQRRSSHASVVDAQVRATSALSLHLFSDALLLVRTLVDLATYLKERIPVPTDRKRQLPALLTELLKRQCVHPDAFVPLTQIKAPLHRVVNVLVEEGTVFSTKMRAPTLVVLEIVTSEHCDAALRDRFRSAVNPRTHAIAQQQSTSSLTKHTNKQSSSGAGDRMAAMLDVLHFLDATSSRNDMEPAPTGSSRRSSVEDDDVDPTTDDHAIHSSSSDKQCDENADAATRERWTTLAAAAAAASSSSSSSVQPCRYFGERWQATIDRYRASSRFASARGWNLLPVIAKSLDDMRQEVFVLQGLRICQLIFQKHDLDLYLRYYSIVCAGKDCGLVEVITDAQSLDALKKKASSTTTTFVQIFQHACGRDPVTGAIDVTRLEHARQRFIVSMAAYSLFSYVFLVKDRHNGNILLTADGHVVHIDFGFVLGIAPGNTFSLETAPFKLTSDMVDVMGPPGSSGFAQYRRLLQQGLMALHMEAPQLLSLVALSSRDSSFPCFLSTSRARILRRMERRLCVGGTAADVAHTAMRIVDKSLDHLGTKQYDWFQQLTNGIAP